MCEVYNDADTCDVFDERNVRARKRYRCYECAGHIDPGTKHWRINTLYDGSWSHYRVCEPCWDTWNRFALEHRSMVIIGGLEENLSECVDYDDASAERWARDLEAMRERRRAAA